MKKKLKAYSKKKQKRQWTRKMLFFLILSLLFLLLLIAILLGRVRIPHFPNTGITPYVSTNGTGLLVNGEPYQFTGVNAFNLGTDPGVNAGCGGPAGNLDTLFSKLRPHSMVRTWAFQGSITTNPTSKQIDWTGLDRVVNAAQKDDIKLILVLGDQAGNCDDGHWKDKAWYAGGYTQAINDYGNGLTPLPYLDYVKLVVSRYKDSTAVAMWEPMNEAIASDCTNGKGYACFSSQTCPDENASKLALRTFFDVVGGTIKSIDTNHLVSSGLGGDGQCGAVFEDYQYVNASPGIDVASYHDYGRDNQAMPGDPYNGLQKRLNQMKLINKPLIVGEVGIQAMDNTSNCMSLAARRDELMAKMDAQFKAGIAGLMPWALTEGVSTTCNYDVGDNDPTLALLHEYPVSMGTFSPTPGPDYMTTPFPTATPQSTPIPDRQAPSAPTNVAASNVTSTQLTLTWTASTDNVGVTKYDIFRNDNYFTSISGTLFTVTGIKPASTYTWFVKGKDAAGNNSGSSNRITITNPDLPPTPTPTPLPTPRPTIAPDTQAPTAPTNLTASDISSTQVTLTWTASIDNVGVTNYDIFLNDNYFTSAYGTSFTISGLIPGTTYTYFVKGKDAAQNNSDSSNRITVTTSP